MCVRACVYMCLCSPATAQSILSSSRRGENKDNFGIYENTEGTGEVLMASE